MSLLLVVVEALGWLALVAGALWWVVLMVDGR